MSDHEPIPAPPQPRPGIPYDPWMSRTPPPIEPHPPGWERDQRILRVVTWAALILALASLAGHVGHALGW